jgi:uncharacterized membrane protein YcaP (DUF421 family)
MIVFFRALLLYLLVIFAVRMMGKRQLGDLQASDIVATILISNIASLPIEDTSLPMMAAILPILTLAAFEICSSEIGLHSRRLRLLFSGRPRVLIREGVIDQQAMKEIRFTLDDLMENLRGEGVFDLQDVWYCIVEANGKVNVLQRFPAKNLTPEDMQLKGSDVLPPVLVIADGQLLPDAMQAYGISQDWLNKMLQLEKKKTEEIFAMTVDGNLQYRIIEKEGKNK